MLASARPRNRLGVLFGAAVAFGCALGIASCAEGSDDPGLGGSGAGNNVGPVGSTTGTGLGGMTGTGSSSAAGLGGATTASSGTGAGKPTSSTTSATSSTTSTTSSTTSTSSTSGGTTCSIAHMVISEVRTRGLGGGSDEFIELWNATGSPITLDDTWSVQGRSSTGGSYSARWTGSGKTIPAWGHYLLGGSSYTETTADDTESGITDAGGLQLVHGGTTIDTLCTIYDTVTLDSTYGCEGTPVLNPHDNTANTNTNASVERAPGGGGGNCTDTGNNEADFKAQMPATPQNTASPATP
jgi:hypothetical protein